MGASDEVSSSRAKVIKTLLEQLREGAKASDVRAKLKAQLGSLSPPEIPLIEQELVKEGVSPVEIPGCANCTSNCSGTLWSATQS